MPTLVENRNFSAAEVVDDSDSVDEQSGHRAKHASQGMSKLRSGACVHCKSLKVKCEFNSGEEACQRCQAGNYQCIARSRKKRKPAPTHEDLQEKAHNQDLQIQALLHQFDKMRADNKVKAWLDRTRDAETDRISPDHAVLRWTTKDVSVESAVTAYFSSGKGFTPLTVPDIVKFCLLYPEDILKLFSIFFERINPFFSILDPELHTPQYLIWTCPFLFTVVCAVASRYYTARPRLYPVAMKFARDAAGLALIDGSKSVDVCQAYLLMGVYPVPKKKWTEDRSWLLMGVAIRMAVELELNQPPPPDCDEREQLNRTRTWLNCYCVDGSHAIQFGKMPMLRLDDYLARNSSEWYRCSSLNIPFDIHLCAYVQIILIAAEWRSRVKDHLQQGRTMELVASVMETQARLSREMSEWVKAYAEDYNSNPLAICSYRGNTTQMITSYLRLVVLATGFQELAKHGLSRDSEIVAKSVEAAQEVIQVMIERLYPTGNLRYAMEAHFLYVSFAAAFLINLLRPKFLPLLDENRQQEITMVVDRLINILISKNVALDGRHTPALYSKFLSTLLARHVRRQSRPESPATEGESKAATYHGNHEQSAYSTIYSWPDVVHNEPPESQASFFGEAPAHQAYTNGEADMDFSLSHFVKTVTQELPPTLPTAMQGSHAMGTNGSQLDAWNQWSLQGKWTMNGASPFQDLWM